VRGGENTLGKSSKTRKCCGEGKKWKQSLNLALVRQGLRQQKNLGERREKTTGEKSYESAGERGRAKAGTGGIYVGLVSNKFWALLHAKQKPRADETIAEGRGIRDEKDTRSRSIAQERRKREGGHRTQKNT